MNINLLVTLDEHYVPHLNVMLYSLINSNLDCYFYVFLLHSSLKDEDVAGTNSILKGHGELTMINANDIDLENAPTTDRFPKEMYYRIFAQKYLPSTIDRVLYLDPDIIVNGSVIPLYSIEMGNYYFAAASHNNEFMRKINSIRLKMPKHAPYINSGAMVINLEILRKEQRIEDIYEFIQKCKRRLILPDQDVISGLYGDKIVSIDKHKYNMTERIYRVKRIFNRMKLDQVRKHAVIIHYCGRNKPWKKNYHGKLNCFYNETIEKMKEAGFTCFK